MFLARLAQDGSSALAQLSFHITIEYGILAGEPLLARPNVAEGAGAMAGFTTDWQQKVLDHSTGKAPIGAAPVVHIALFIVPPTDTSGGTECNDTGYGRVATSAATWNAATGTAASNAQAVGFGACAGGRNEVVAFGAYGGRPAATCCGGGASSLSVSAGITPSFGPGTLKATLD